MVHTTVRVLHVDEPGVNNYVLKDADGRVLAEVNWLTLNGARIATPDEMEVGGPVRVDLANEEESDYGHPLAAGARLTAA